MLPFARTKPTESHGPSRRLDVPGLALAGAGLLGIVWALVRGNAASSYSLEVIGAGVAGIAALAAFVAWELRAPAPMLPMRFFRSRGFAAANAASLAMYFVMFGWVFLLTQFLHLVMGYGPLEAGIRTFAWTAMPLVVAPAAGALSDKIGGRPIMAFGLALDAFALGWMAAIAAPDRTYGQLAPAHVVAGIGTAAFFAPVANVVMAAVPSSPARPPARPTQSARSAASSGSPSSPRCFANQGDYETLTAFMAGFTPTLTIGAATVALGAAAALVIPRRRTAAVSPQPLVQPA
jgi:hypothetical protein